MGEFVRIERAFSMDIMMILAAEDPDLMAYIELQKQGFTDLPISQTRQDILEDYPESQLFSEIKAAYNLTERATNEAFNLAVQDFNDRNAVK